MLPSASGAACCSRLEATRLPYIPAASHSGRISKAANDSRTSGMSIWVTVTGSRSFGGWWMWSLRPRSVVGVHAVEQRQGDVETPVLRLPAGVHGGAGECQRPVETDPV